MKEIYNTLTTEFATSAREYFMVLRLAIYHVASYYAERSADVMKYLEEADNEEEIYELACGVLKALNKEGEKHVG